jgi:hypothetical protein
MNAVDRLMLNPSGMLGSTQLVDFPPYQFLQGIYRSHANFAVFTAPMRSLTGWWMGAQFGLQWLMTYAQICGIPQRIAYYEPGDDKVYAELVSMMRASASASWGVYPKGTQIEFQTAGGSESANPQERLIELADKMCDIVLLGQTLTTEVHESGSRALGTVHKSVWEEKTEAAAYYVSRIINSDLVPGIIEFNYGNTDELPILEPVVESNIDLVQMANAFSTLFGAGQNGMKIPITKEELYRRLEFTQPDPDADLYDPLGGQTAAATPSSPARQPGEEPPKEAGLGGGGDALKEAGGRIEPETSEFLPASASFVEAKRGRVSLKKKPALDRGPVEEADALATQAYFAQNAALIRGVDWRSVMDDRTTAECRELNGKRWSYPDFEPQGHGAEWPGFPPIRWNCRSKVKPVLRIGATPGKPVVRVRTVGKKVRLRKRQSVMAQEGGGNPYHDEKGKFTSGPSAAGPKGPEAKGGKPAPANEPKPAPKKIGIVWENEGFGGAEAGNTPFSAMKEMYGENMHIYPGAGVAEQVKDLTRAPASVHGTLAGFKTEVSLKIQIGTGNVTSLPAGERFADIKETPRGYSEGLTYKDCPGLYDQIDNQILVGGQGGGVSTSLHELGHAFDAKFYIKDQSTRITDAYHEFFDNNQGEDEKRWYAYYMQGGRDGEAGKSEMFAEGFARYIKKGPSSVDGGWRAPKLAALIGDKLAAANKFYVSELPFREAADKELEERERKAGRL